MSLICDDAKCVQCGRTAITEGNLRTDEIVGMCHACGFHYVRNTPTCKVWEAVCDHPEQQETVFFHTIEENWKKGYGVLWVYPIGSDEGSWRVTYPAEPIKNADEVFRLILEAYPDLKRMEDIDLERSYGTRWDDETGEIEILFGSPASLPELWAEPSSQELRPIEGYFLDEAFEVLLDPSREEFFPTMEADGSLWLENG